MQLTLITGDPPRPRWCCLLIEVKLDLCIFVTSKYWGCHWGHWRREVIQTSSVTPILLFFWLPLISTSGNLLFYVIPAVALRFVLIFEWIAIFFCYSRNLWTNSVFNNIQGQGNDFFLRGARLIRKMMFCEFSKILLYKSSILRGARAPWSPAPVYAIRLTKT